MKWPENWYTWFYIHLKFWRENCPLTVSTSHISVILRFDNLISQKIKGRSMNGQSFFVTTANFYCNRLSCMTGEEEGGWEESSAKKNWWTSLLLSKSSPENSPQKRHKECPFFSLIFFSQWREVSLLAFPTGWTMTSSRPYVYIFFHPDNAGYTLLVFNIFHLTDFNQLCESGGGADFVKVTVTSVCTLSCIFHCDFMDMIW